MTLLGGGPPVGGGRSPAPRSRRRSTRSAVGEASRACVRSRSTAPSRTRAYRCRSDLAASPTACPSSIPRRPIAYSRPAAARHARWLGTIDSPQPLCPRSRRGRDARSARERRRDHSKGNSCRKWTPISTGNVPTTYCARDSLWRSPTPVRGPARTTSGCLVALHDPGLCVAKGSDETRG
jgi:hypothetical protein